MTPRRLCLMFAAMLVSHKPLAAAAERLLFETDWRAGVDVRLGVQAAAPSDVWVEHALGMQMPAHRLHVRIRRDADFSRVANGAPRAEAVFSNVARFASGKRYVIAWQTWIPPDYSLDGMHTEIMTQIHQRQASGPPPVMLTLTGSQYTISVRGGVHTQHGAGVAICCADADRGKWVTWRLDYQPDSTGKEALTVLRKGGRVVYDGAGSPNAYPAESQAYLKIGLYDPDHWQKAPEAVISRTLVYGPVRILEITQEEKP